MIFQELFHNLEEKVKLNIVATKIHQHLLEGLDWDMELLLDESLEIQCEKHVAQN
jgi:predicted metal-dependent HD superfamily phosphohydrolase